MTYYLTDSEYQTVKKLYTNGLSAQEIKDYLGLITSVRQIQRRLAKDKLTRTVGDSFRLAVSKGRVPYKRNKRGKAYAKTLNNL